MNIHRARSLLLKTFIGFLALTALIGIVTVLTGEFGEVQLKTLGTTFTISAASICAMACAAFIEKRNAPALGWVGIALNFSAATMLIFAMWAEFGDAIYWKLTLTLIVLGLAFAHALLMHLPTLAEEYEWVQAVTAGAISVLALLIIVAFWGEVDNSAYYRVLAVVSIIVVLLTLVIPILLKLGKAPADAETARPSSVHAGQLVLTPVDGQYYEDAQGVVYRVEKVPAPGKETGV